MFRSARLAALLISGSIQATLPFASLEMLQNIPYHITGKAVHDSIHDMKSFFWVLLYLCLTRDGPGGSRREELKGENCGGDANSVEQIVYCFFDSEDKHDLAHNRRLLFNDHEDMKDHIVEQFHPYFDVLKPLVIEWWRLLRFAYYSGSYTPMHEPLLAVLNSTLEDIAKMPPSTPSAATLAELERRKQDLIRVRLFRVKQKTVGVGRPLQSGTVERTQASAFPQLLALSGSVGKVMSISEGPSVGSA